MLFESSTQAGFSCGLVEMPFSQGGSRPLQCDRVQDCVRARLPQHNISHQGQTVTQVDKGMEGSKEGGVSQKITKVSCKFAQTP